MPARMMLVLPYVMNDSFVRLAAGYYTGITVPENWIRLEL
jgi:hypothetical protein